MDAKTNACRMDLKQQNFKNGLIISSSALILEKGNADISLHLKLTYDLLSEYSKIKSNPNNREARENKIKNKFLENAFVISYTYEIGWYNIPLYKISIKNRIVTIKFRIEEHYKCISLFDPILHDGNFKTQWPCIKLIPNPNSIYTSYDYDFLKIWNLEQIRIVAEVSDVSNLKLSNSNGEIDNTIPFAPFGPIPINGSFLSVQNPLIFQKYLSSFEISICWSSLPELKDGFKEYYKAYPHEITSQSFTAILTSKLTIKDNVKTINFNLFESNEGYLKEHKNIKVNVADLDFNNNIIGDDEGAIENSHSVYILLRGPEIAFGHHVFSDLYSKAAMQEVRRSSSLFSGLFKKTPVLLPKQPYTPVINTLIINYTNTVKENVLQIQNKESTNIKLFQIFPIIDEIPEEKEINFILNKEVNNPKVSKIDKKVEIGKLEDLAIKSDFLIEDMEKLSKMKIIAYSDSKYLKDIGFCNVNSSAYSIIQNEVGKNYFHIILVFDGTVGISKEPVEYQIRKVKDIAYKFDADIHKPNYLGIYLDTKLLFKGRLSSLNVKHFLLDTDGTPLRSEVELKF
jgi:hypothetical protein